jgi:hypothetical protein
MQRQMGEVCIRLAVVESRPGPSAASALPYSQPLLLGLPGCGGLPASGPVISEILPTPSASPTTAGTPSLGAPSAASGVAVSQPPLTGLPI